VPVLGIESDRLGTVADIRAYLEAIEQAYNGLYAFDLIVNEAKARAADLEPRPSWRSSGRRSRINVRRIRRAEAVVLPEDRLQLRAVVFQSPGSWDFLGALNPLETLRKYLQDRHERRRDRTYREPLEAERMALENQRLKTEVVKQQVELLRSIGVPEEKIREALTAHVVLPLERLDRHQDSGLIQTAAPAEQAAGGGAR
jgi:hypothetical protein